MNDSLRRCNYSIIRYAHDPVRQEAINVAVMIWPIGQPAGVVWRYDATMKRVERLYPSANPRAVVAALAAFKETIEHHPDVLLTGSFGGTGVISATEPRGVHTADLEVEVSDLYETLVAPAEEDTDEPRERTRSSRYIKGRMNDFFKRMGVFHHVSGDERAQQLRSVACASGVRHTFDFAYKNGAIHRIDAISFDHGSNQDRITRARSFANLVDDVQRATDFAGGALVEAVVQVPTESIQADIFGQVMKILGTVSAEIVEVRDDRDLEAYCENTRTSLHA